MRLHDLMVPSELKYSTKTGVFRTFFPHLSDALLVGVVLQGIGINYEHGILHCAKQIFI